MNSSFLKSEDNFKLNCKNDGCIVIMATHGLIRMESTNTYDGWNSDKLSL